MSTRTTLASPATETRKSRPQSSLLPAYTLPTSPKQTSHSAVSNAQDRDGKTGQLPHPFEPGTVYHDGLPTVPKSQPVRPLSIDAQTPDHWIARDERMVRLTGKHPFNVEAPLAPLYKAGFLTPQNLFYVRTHGDTPRVSQEQAKGWKLQVHGLVEREVSFTISDLKRLFPVVTVPITLVCAGNRRKEQNMVTKGLGFNWGAAGVSTGLFTGVYLSDILKYCRPKNPLLSSYPSYDEVVPNRARHVIFEGADDLPKGKYGTSQRLKWALDQDKAMMICWGLNGEDLSPDHGYPLRLVVPGQIGGRMVKWLQRIEVSDRESQHYLHFFDNKLLPTQVTADEARSQDKWWYDPKYIINELNVNAAVCSPDHNAVVQLAESSEKQILPIEGYAYTGGGRRITRVEVSLDDGKTWQLANISYPEDAYRMSPVGNHPYFGTLDLSMTEMSFCWCFWRLEVDLKSDIIDRGATVIAVRAMDEALSVMPRDMYWNAMSMMNSWWFRVAVHKSDDGKSVTFEHPTLAGNAEGGWMQRMNKEGLNPRYPQFGPSLQAEKTPQAPVEKEAQLDDIRDPEKCNTVVSAAEFAEHSPSDCPSPWFIVHGHVYDGTGYLEDHPGGDQSIRLVAGEDATEDFMAIHSADAKVKLREFHLGRFEKSTLQQSPASSPDDSSATFLQPKVWKGVRLVEKKQISSDARIFRFALPREDQELGLPVGQHVYLRIKSRSLTSGETVVTQRAYTPYSDNSQRGFIDILIKVYFPSSNGGTAFAGGKMTMLLEAQSPGQEDENTTIEMKGPIGHFTYLGKGQVKILPKFPSRKVTNIAMIAGGSGITPIWSTLKAIADEVADGRIAPDSINISLVCGNRTEQDILLRADIEKLRSIMGDSLKVWHALSALTSLPEDWVMGRGHVDIHCLRQHLPAPAESTTATDGGKTLALVCGPPAMEKAVSNGLRELGWDLDNDVVFF